MTEQTNTELIAEVRERRWGKPDFPEILDLMHDLAERLEAADQRAELAEANLSVEESKNAGYRAKNNQLAVVVEKVQEYADQVDPANLDEQPMWPSTLRELLATAPADALRDLKADVWDEAIAHVETFLGAKIKRAAHTDNPYRAREERA